MARSASDREKDAKPRAHAKHGFFGRMLDGMRRRSAARRVRRGARVVQSDDGAIEINGLTLPDRLAAMIRAGEWRAPRDKHALEKMTAFVGVGTLRFLGPEEIAAEVTSAADVVDRGQGDLYGVCRAGMEKGAAIPEGVLPIDRYVVIATSKRGEAIALVYGKDDGPSVMATFEIGNGQCRWRQIAGSFEAFVKALGSSGNEAATD